ncbi:putative metal-dependent hydrolase [Sphingobacterium sp. SRCM116780]|uniref:YfiT family bacillithiol transferase n=1 Tax=Sphingobacterium sp. SRCM116780 TaxID=2907623 RepID=UPI001F415AAE|nr:putative metal-dependent hydrolase [Sphingobacterium sp. SRCM116780]UIR54599.1 putative metal-dependent hydrolase [Sphingobacterium sp. SRCM116780]
MQQELEKLKYPIGKFSIPATIDSQVLEEWIKTITEFPSRLTSEVAGLSEATLNKQYRPESWTIRQVVHHCADSHMNSFLRFKLALTEENPTIKPYEENLWAALPDTKIAPIVSSLKLLEGLHERWTILLRNLTQEQLERTFIHPQTKQLISLKVNIGIYAWHCNHHLMHILNAKNNKL